MQKKVEEAKEKELGNFSMVSLVQFLTDEFFCHMSNPVLIFEPLTPRKTVRCWSESGEGQQN